MYDAYVQCAIYYINNFVRTYVDFLVRLPLSISSDRVGLLRCESKQCYYGVILVGSWWVVVWGSPSPRGRETGAGY